MEEIQAVRNGWLVLAGAGYWLRSLQGDGDNDGASQPRM